jgi:catechol 2,3-dioxygenase-like lactoylglutathione lyase family enzyme
MINGLHAIMYSRDAEADRAFFRDVLGFPAIDAGQGWLIFAGPPSEVAFHPDEKGSHHEFYLMCDDVAAEVKRLTGKGAACGPISDEGWGLLTTLRLPSGTELGLYEPRHPTGIGKNG